MIGIFFLWVSHSLLLFLYILGFSKISFVQTFPTPLSPLLYSPSPCLKLTHYSKRGPCANLQLLFNIYTHPLPSISSFTPSSLLSSREPCLSFLSSRFTACLSPRIGKLSTSLGEEGPAKQERDGERTVTAIGRVR